MALFRSGMINSGGRGEEFTMPFTFYSDERVNSGIIPSDTRNLEAFMTITPPTGYRITKINVTKNETYDASGANMTYPTIQYDSTTTSVYGSKTITLNTEKTVKISYDSRNRHGNSVDMEFTVTFTPK